MCRRWLWDYGTVSKRITIGKRTRDGPAVLPNGVRLSCGAKFEHTQTYDSFKRRRRQLQARVRWPAHLLSPGHDKQFRATPRTGAVGGRPVAHKRVSTHTARGNDVIGSGSLMAKGRQFKVDRGAVEVRDESTILSVPQGPPCTRRH